MKRNNNKLCKNSLTHPQNQQKLFDTKNISLVVRSKRKNEPREHGTKTRHDVIDSNERNDVMTLLMQMNEMCLQLFLSELNHMNRFVPFNIIVFSQHCSPADDWIGFSSFPKH